MKQDFQRRAAPYVFVSPFLLLFCVFMVYPLVRSLMLSFYKTVGPRHMVFMGFGNYRYLLGHDRLFWLSVLNTVLFTTTFLILEIPMALILAIMLNNPRLWFRNLFRFAFFSSYLVGQVFVAVIFFQMFSPSGMVNRFLSLLIRQPVTIPWLNDPNFVLPSLLIAMLWLYTGHGMVYFLAALQAVDPQLYEAAEMDGAGPIGKFFHVTLPGIRPVLVFVILIGTIGAFQLFELPYVLFQGPGPGWRGMTIVMDLFLNGFSSGDLGYASAIGWTMVLMLLLVSLVQIKFSRASADV